MALKNPSELFGTVKKVPVNPAVNVGKNVNNIKEEFNKVEELRKQIDNVSSSLNTSLTEVVDKNLSFLSNEYSNLLEKFNNKIDEFKVEINYKVDDLEKNNKHLKTEIQVVEQRQQTINLSRIKKEVLSEVNNLLSGNVADNIKRLEEKIEVVRDSYQQTLNEGLLNEPPSTDNSDPLTPLDQNFATIDDLNKHYQLFLNRIQQQLSTLGGGGAVNIRDLDDVDQSSARVNNKFLKYDSASAKWVGADASGGGAGITTENVGAQTLTVAGISTFNDDVVFKGASTNAKWDKSKNDLVLYNNTRLTLGDNEDFQMWHGGTHTFIKNTGGDLRIRGDVIKLAREDSTESYLQATKNEDVKLFYNGVEKFATTLEGVNVTGLTTTTNLFAVGVVTATSFIGDGSGLTGITGSGSGVVVKHDGSAVGTAGTINFSTNLDVSAISAGVVTVTASGGSGITTENVGAQTLTVAGISTFNFDVQFPGAAYNIHWDQPTSKFKFDDSAQCVWGSASGGDLRIWHASDVSNIKNETGALKIAGNDIRLQSQNNSEDYLLAVDGGSVSLFFNDAKRFETSGIGATVSGRLDSTTLNVTGVSTFGDSLDVEGQLYVASNIRHIGDTDTYIEFTNDQIRIIAGGKALIHAEESTIDTVVINDGSNDLDFRVEGLNDEHLIFSDGSTDRVGIGSATPTQKLDVDGNVKATTYYGDGSNLTGISAVLDSRGTTSAATGSIAQTASANITIPTRGKSFSLLKVAISAPAWVVLYVDSASRSSDSSRTEGTDPAPGSGVLTEVSTTTSGASTFLMSPAVLGWNNDSTPAAQIYAKVTNKRATSGSNAITVTLTTIKLEA